MPSTSFASGSFEVLALSMRIETSWWLAVSTVSSWAQRPPAHTFRFAFVSGAPVIVKVPLSSTTA